MRINSLNLQVSHLLSRWLGNIHLYEVNKYLLRCLEGSWIPAATRADEAQVPLADHCRCPMRHIE